VKIAGCIFPVRAVRESQKTLTVANPRFLMSHTQDSIVHRIFSSADLLQRFNAPNRT